MGLLKRTHICGALIALTFTFNAHADFKGYQISPCQYWMPSSNGGYVCQNIPQSIVVPQAGSLAQLLKEQNARIAELEKKMADLTAQCESTHKK